MEKEKFLEMITSISKVYRIKVDEDTIAMYYEFLKDIEEDILKKAFKRIIEKNIYFPTIAHIRQEVVKIKSPELSLNAEDEFEKVRKAVRNFDIYDSENALATLKPITRRVLGMTCSWYELCMSTDITWIKKDFIAIFNREIGKAEKIEMLGNSAEQREKEYKEQLLKEEAEIEKQLQIETEEL